MNPICIRLILLVSFSWMFLVSSTLADDPNVPSPYAQYFAKHSDTENVFSKSVAPLLEGQGSGRSYALIAGVWKYSFGDLRPAQVDIEELKDYLIDEEHFDEVVVLTNDDVNFQNLHYFLQTYFADQLDDFPRSRFLFAYSGHGFLDGDAGYLVLPNARNVMDRSQSISVNTLGSLIEIVTDRAHHSLILLNACNAGSFLNYSFGDHAIIPKKRGAHAITAGGTNEKAYAISSLGNGSVFYEVLLDGIRGDADTDPREGDGIVTVSELYGYLHRRTTEVVPPVA